MKFYQAINGNEIEFTGVLSPEEIKKFRKSLGLTQVEAADLCGGGPNAFSRYERGKSKPSRATCNLLISLVGGRSNVAGNSLIMEPK